MSETTIQQQQQKPKEENKSSKSFNLLGSMAVSLAPVLTQLISKICEEYPQIADKEQEMIKKYIHDDGKVWKKMVNKFKPKNTRSKSGYTIFLSDPVMIETIKSENKGEMMKNLNPNKGLKWKDIKTNNKKMYERYCLIAKLFNNKLIDCNDKNQTELRNTIELWMYKKTLKEINELAKKIKVPEKKIKKKKLKKVKTEVSKKTFELEKTEEKKKVIPIKNNKNYVDDNSDDDNHSVIEASFAPDSD